MGVGGAGESVQPSVSPRGWCPLSHVIVTCGREFLLFLFAISCKEVHHVIDSLPCIAFRIAGHIYGIIQTRQNLLHVDDLMRENHQVVDQSAADITGSMKLNSISVNSTPIAGNRQLRTEMHGEFTVSQATRVSFFMIPYEISPFNGHTRDRYRSNKCRCPDEMDSER